MALRGETVGTAFVRILADGSGLDQSIKDEMRQREGVFEQAGRTDSEAYKHGFEDETKKRGGINKIADQLREAAGRFDAVGQIAGSEFLDGLDKQFRSRFGTEIGDRLGVRLRERLVDSADASEIGRFVDNIGVHVAAVTREIQAEEKEAAESIKRTADDFEKSWRKSMDKIESDTNRTLHAIDVEAGKLRRSFQQVGDDIQRGFARSARDFESDVARIARAQSVLNRNTDHTRSNINGLSVIIGRAFGKGSRNNAFNFFGTIVGGLSNLLEHIPGVKQGLTGLSNVIKDMEQNGTGFFEALAKEGGGLAGSLRILATAGATLVVVFAALVFILGPLVSLFAGLAGGIFAVASSIGFALGAGLGVFAGLLPVIATGIGGVVVALTSLSKKDFKNIFQPFIDGFHEVQDLLAKPLTDSFAKAVPRIVKQLEPLKPLVQAIGDTIAQLPIDLARLTESPAFDKFIRAFNEFIPGALSDLQHIGSTAGRILLGFFRATLPITGRFLDFLRKTAHQFAIWINSKDGQRNLKEFFRQAAKSAETIADFLGTVVELIGKLAEKARPSGDTLFQQLTDKAKEFIDFIDKHPKVISKWFSDAAEITSAVASALESIVHLIDAFDTPENRKAAVLLFRIIAGAVDITARAVSRFFSAIQNGLIKAGEFIANLRGIFVRVGNKIQEIADHIKGAFEDVANLFQGKLPTNIISVIPAIERLTPHFVTLAAKAGGAAGDIITRFNSIPDRINGIVARFGRIGTNLANTFFNNVVQGLFGIAEAIIALFPTASEILDHIGDIDIGSLIHVPSSVHIPLPGGGVNIPIPHGIPGPLPLAPKIGGAGFGAGGSTINFNIVTPTKDPVAVARETVNQLVASSLL